MVISSLDIDECVGSPCKNGATCQNIPGSHKCNCKPGFTGRDCGKGEHHKNGSLLFTNYLLRNCQRGLWTQETTFLGLTELHPLKGIFVTPLHLIISQKQTNK